MPYRDRANHLARFIPHMNQRLRTSRIYIIEQADEKPFNRAKLLNIGFLEFSKDFDGFAAHDVDMLPSKADYSFPTCPTHIATKVEQFRYKMPYPQYFGGVTLFPNEDFRKANGYSNNFWGWGAEDDELYKHMVSLGITIERRQCFFQSLHHTRKLVQEDYKRNIEYLKMQRSSEDGLTHCKYEIVKLEEKHNYTKLKVLL